MRFFFKSCSENKLNTKRASRTFKLASAGFGRQIFVHCSLIGQNLVQRGHYCRHKPSFIRFHAFLWSRNDRRMHRTCSILPRLASGKRNKRSNILQEIQTRFNSGNFCSDCGYGRSFVAWNCLLIARKNEFEVLILVFIISLSVW